MNGQSVIGVGLPARWQTRKVTQPSEAIGRIVSLPEVFGTAWYVSRGTKLGYVSFTEVFSGRSWEECWYGVRSRLWRGDLQLIEF